MRSGQVRRRAAVAVVLLVLATTSGCGFMNALAHPDAESGAAAASTTGSVVAAAGIPAPEKPRVIVDADLTTGARSAGHLTVTVGRVQTGLVPPVPNVADCPFDGPTLQYVPVDFAFSSPGLAARVRIDRGPATPADVADIGIFMESGDGYETYCDDAPPLPKRDRFWNQMGAATVTAYVVLDQAVTPGTPAGRPFVFPTLQLQISDLRLLDDPAHGRGLGVGDLSVGAACTDDPDAICVPLG